MPLSSSVDGTQLTAWPFGSVTVHETVPVGVGPDPETVAVKLKFPPGATPAACVTDRGAGCGLGDGGRGVLARTGVVVGVAAVVGRGRIIAHQRVSLMVQVPMPLSSSADTGAADRLAVRVGDGPRARARRRHAGPRDGSREAEAPAHGHAGGVIGDCGRGSWPCRPRPSCRPSCRCSWRRRRCNRRSRSRCPRWRAVTVQVPWPLPSSVEGAAGDSGAVRIGHRPGHRTRRGHPRSRHGGGEAEAPARVHAGGVLG